MYNQKVIPVVIVPVEQATGWYVLALKYHHDLLPTVDKIIREWREESPTEIYQIYAHNHPEQDSCQFRFGKNDNQRQHGRLLYSTDENLVNLTARLFFYGAQVEIIEPYSYPNAEILISNRKRHPQMN